MFFQLVECHLLYFTGDVILAALRRLDNAPIQHDTLTQCWVKVKSLVDAGPTILKQHWTSSRVCCEAPVSRCRRCSRRRAWHLCQPQADK